MLIVDDDVGTLAAFDTLLKLAGHDVHTSPTGQGALEKVSASRGTFDLVVTDLRLPDMSGLEVLAELRERCPNLPVAMMSAWATEPIELAARRLGSVEFAHKPIWDFPELVDRALRATGLSQVRAPDDSDVGYAARRWATLVLSVAHHRADVPTVIAWSRQVGKAPATLKNWCKAARVTAGDSLDFARMLRLVHRFAGRRIDWYSVLG